jgi:hypothetical protein
MRAEESEGIGMASGEEGVNLRVEARIGGSDRYSSFHGWTLLRQVDGLQDAANAGDPMSLDRKRTRVL